MSHRKKLITSHVLTRPRQDSGHDDQMARHDGRTLDQTHTDFGRNRLLRLLYVYISTKLQRGAKVFIIGESYNNE